jgi:hypothetical protein
MKHVLFSIRSFRHLDICRSRRLCVWQSLRSYEQLFRWITLFSTAVSLMNFRDYEIFANSKSVCLIYWERWSSFYLLKTSRNIHSRDNHLVFQFDNSWELHTTATMYSSLVSRRIYWSRYDWRILSLIQAEFLLSSWKYSLFLRVIFREFWWERSYSCGKKSQSCRRSRLNDLSIDLYAL